MVFLWYWVFLTSRAAAESLTPWAISDKRKPRDKD